MQAPLAGPSVMRNTTVYYLNQYLTDTNAKCLQKILFDKVSTAQLQGAIYYLLGLPNTCPHKRVGWTWHGDHALHNHFW